MALSHMCKDHFSKSIDITLAKKLSNIQNHLRYKIAHKQDLEACILLVTSTTIQYVYKSLFLATFPIFCKFLGQRHFQYNIFHNARPNLMKPTNKCTQSFIEGLPMVQYYQDPCRLIPKSSNGRILSMRLSKNIKCSCSFMY